MGKTTNSAATTPLRPTLIMEASWEVCNKVGGIYTVLSTRVATMIEHHGRSNILFIGPKLTGKQPDFKPSRLKDHTKLAERLSVSCGLKVHIGKWDIEGRPTVALVEYQDLADEKDNLYFKMWEAYGIRGEIGYGDYDDSCLFAIAAARVMMAYHELYNSEQPIAIFNEWTTGMGLLELQMSEIGRDIKTLFITHATSVGRSIAGNGKPLYSQLPNYNGDQMADELGVMCKHQVEKAAAQHADIFGTVSEVTAREAEQLLGRYPEAILYNGFEEMLVPSGPTQRSLRTKGRKAIRHLANTLYGTQLSQEPFIIATSGRNEYRNKGLDIYIDALRRLSQKEELQREVIALITVPGWVQGPREELQYALQTKEELTLPMQMPYLTHILHDGLGNQILAHLDSLRECWGKGVYPIFIPEYLHGSDGILDIAYYDLLPALDMAIFASYYEPWGYTPLESAAFGIPTLTTDKAGFGLWAMEHNTENCFRYGVKALERNDDNFEELAETIATKITRLSGFTKEMTTQSKQRAKKLAKKASWHLFYESYLQAYDEALKKE